MMENLLKVRVKTGFRLNGISKSSQVLERLFISLHSLSLPKARPLNYLLEYSQSL